MGRSGFNVPVFSDSAVNQSDERSEIVGQQPVYLVSSTATCTPCTENLHGKDNDH